MKKNKEIKLTARDHVKKLRRDIKMIRIGRISDVQTVFEAFEIKTFAQGEGCRIERKKSFLRRFF